MAQFNFEENSEIEELHIEPTDVMTGDRNRSRYLLYQLKLSMARAKQIDIIVSFLMESGVRMLLSDLKAALQRGVRIRILTGNYLGITQPSALFLLKKELGNKVELCFYNDKNRSFHPKSYIFHYENLSEIYIGSSNISRSALTSGIEWNYRFNNNQDSQNFNLFYETFEDLFKNHSYVIDDAELKAYSKNWHKPAIAKDLARYDQTDPDTKVEVLFQPRGAQIEALCALENSRAEGASRGLVHAATGVGKTYLAAFDSAKYERVLFVAHREEILKQAAVSFKNVRHSDDYGFFDGKQKDIGKSVIFASVATLGRSEYLTEEYFAPDYFTYLVYYNVDYIHTAIYENKQIKFHYAEWTVKKELKLKKNGAFYVVSPWTLTWDDENYYLVAYDAAAGIIKHYRVDKMRDTEIMEVDRKGEESFKNFDLAAFAKKTFGMYGGVDAEVTLECRNELAGVVIDRFGHDVWMCPHGEDRFRARVPVAVSSQFFGWITGIGSGMRIVGPEDVRQQYKGYLQNAIQNYMD